MKAQNSNLQLPKNISSPLSKITARRLAEKESAVGLLYLPIPPFLGKIVIPLSLISDNRAIPSYSFVTKC
ncbi:hypothetical protein GYMLUDRAFT_819152 [Collybiopsis luxurians FD-317 M1]|uniref:Unplaced genomic scaffold GYMLUscaffold_50, whole genome shotgun sequence n=1 Tax=Collybiopsis luxurians FD-317 M1 TaxID=944289 RepID=A0A0D0CMF8_9AGAR|nr:hypothetical protein GYMLUDRAFT_819152 [Collybiopsis luxurians FD-317 M1]